MLIDAVIFDLDGVIVNTEPIYRESNRELFRQLHINVSPAQYESFVGLSAVKMWKTLHRQFNLSQSIDTLIELEAANRYDQLQSMSELRPVAGVKHLLEQLKDHNKILALATSSPRKNAGLILSRLGLENHFNIIVTGEDVANGKPAPDIFLKAAELAAARAPTCLVIEDSRNGVIGATAAGMMCVGYRNRDSGQQDLSSATLIIDDFGPAARKAIMGLVL